MKVKIQSTKTCVTHNVKHEFEVDEELAIVSIEEDLKAWRSGSIYLQDLRYLTADQREMLLTGMCANAWDSMFAPTSCNWDCDGTSHPGLMCKD